MSDEGTREQASSPPPSKPPAQPFKKFPVIKNDAKAHRESEINSRAKITDKEAKFIHYYCLYANVARAAKAAGYSERSGRITGYRILKKKKVQSLLASYATDREAHARQTYMKLCETAELAFEHMKALAQRAKSVTLQDLAANPELADALPRHEDVSRSIEICGRQLERLAKCEGLHMEGGENPNALKGTLQELAKRAKEWKALPAVESKAV